MRSDKGKKRKNYDMSLRRARQNFRLLRLRLNHKVKVVEGRPRKERRQEARRLMLPDDRRCPICGKIKLNSRQWIVGKHDLFTAICKSCYMKGK